MGWKIRKVGIVTEIILNENKRIMDFTIINFIFKLDNKEDILCKFTPTIKVGYKVEVIGNYSDREKMFVANYIRWLNPQTKLTQFNK